MIFKAVVGTDLLGRKKEAEYNTFAEAARHSEQITVELTGAEFLALQHQTDKMQSQLEKLNASVQESQQYGQKAVKDRENILAHYTDLKAKYELLQQEIKTMYKQQKSFELVKNELAAAHKELAYWRQLKPNRKVESVKVNPYADGVAMKKGKPSPRQAVEHSERSKQLLKHLEFCPVLTRLAVERILACPRKTAVAALDKLYKAGYLEYVTFIGSGGGSEIKLYYAPGQIQGPTTENQACQAAVLPLLYANLQQSQSTFQNLSFVIRKNTPSRIDARKHPEEMYYVAMINYTFVRKTNDQIKEQPRALFAVPIRGKNIDYPAKLQSDRERITLFIFPTTLSEAAERAEKIAKREEKEIAYLVDEMLLKNSVTISYKK